MKAAFAVIILNYCCLISACGLGNYFSVGHNIAGVNAMAPTIAQGDHFAHMRIKVDGKEFLNRFDIIVFEANSDYDNHIKENTRFVFRVIGLEGETVELRKGKVFINGKLLEEPFEKIESGDSSAPFVVPQSGYFVLGDNRPNSFDSRFWKNKAVKRDHILGVVSNIIRKEDYDKGKRW